MINIEEATRARRGYKVLFKDSEGYMRRGAFTSRTAGGKLLVEVTDLFRSDLLCADLVSRTGL